MPRSPLRDGRMGAEPGMGRGHHGLPMAQITVELNKKQNSNRGSKSPKRSCGGSKIGFLRAAGTGIFASNA